jgi:hypothetical protein
MLTGTSEKTSFSSNFPGLGTIHPEWTAKVVEKN